MEINKEIANNLFSNHGLPAVHVLRKIEVGFTNDVYDIDGEYILKVCRETSNEPFFRREALLYEYFKEILPVPQLLVYDDTKSLLDAHYLIYPKIRGENLYNVWHVYSEPHRKEVVRQLCDILKKINETDLEGLPPEVHLEVLSNWKSKILDQIENYLEVVTAAGTLSADEARSIRTFVSKKSGALDEQKIALVYWDAHFDNIIVEDGEIVGILDFERTEAASIDFALDVVRRMVRFPAKYMSEHAEQFAKEEDYKNLMLWHQEYYPALFEFSNLNTRLDLYSIAHDIKQLEGWPNSTSLKDNVLRAVA